jgi:hypothetical protein
MYGLTTTATVRQAKVPFLEVYNNVTCTLYIPVNKKYGRLIVVLILFTTKQSTPTKTEVFETVCNNDLKWSYKYMNFYLR